MSATAAQPPPTRSGLRLRTITGDHTVLAVGVLTVLVLALRFSQIGQSLIGDETFTYGDIVGKRLSAVLSGVQTGGENSPPLFFVLAYLSIKLGDPTVWIRLPSIVLGAGTIPVVYLIGRETVGRNAGLLAATLLAVSPFTLYYGVEARPYATVMFFVALSTLALLRAIDTGSRTWWAAYAAAAAAAAYTHYTAIFVLAVQGLWSLWVCRRRIAPALIASGAVAVLYLPWLPHVRGKALGVIAILEPLNVHNVLTDLARALVGYPYAHISQIPTRAGLIVAGVSALGCLCWWGWQAVAARREGELGGDQRLILLVALAVATPAGLLLYSLLGTDVWLARGLTASLPAVSLVIAAALLRPPRAAAVAAIAVAVIVLALGTIKAVQGPYVRGPFRTVASYLDRHAAPRDPIVYFSIVGQPAVAEQLQKPHIQTTAKPLIDHQVPVARRARVYLVLDDFMRDGLRLRPQTMLPGYRLVSDRHFDGMFPTEVLRYRPR